MKHASSLGSRLTGVLGVTLTCALGSCGDDGSATNGDTTGSGAATTATTTTTTTVCPNVSAGPDVTIFVADVDPTLGGTPTASGGSPPYTYSWTGDVAYLSSTTDANPTFDVAAAGLGNYEVCVEVTDGSACDGVSDCVTVTVSACPTATVAPSPSAALCAGEELVLDAGEHATYLWSTGATTRTITVNTAATYSVHVTDAGGCAADAELTVGPSSSLVSGSGVEVGETGMRPKLIASPDGDPIYLFFSSPTAKVKTFDVATEAWLDGTLEATATANTLFPFSGQGFAVDPAGNLHVIWGEEGTTDCIPSMQTADQVRHVVYDGTSWGIPRILASRSNGDDRCAFQNVALGADGAGRLAALYQTPLNGTENHPKWYRVFDGTAWSAEQAVGDDQWKASTLAVGGGAGNLYLGYWVAPGAVDAALSLILPGSFAISETTVLTSSDTDQSADVFVESSGTAHAVWESGHPHCNPQCHPTGIYYTHREADTWVEGTSGARLVCASLFDENPGDEQSATPHIAVSPSGTKLVVFTYMTELYYVAQINGAWGPVRQVDIDVDALWSYPIALGPSDRFLVVWSTRNTRFGVLYSTILQP